MKQTLLTYFAIASALLMMSCSSDHVIEDIHDITESTDPMRFSGINNQNQVTRTDPTIPNLLKQNFLVSTYKNFGNANQQTVMPMYEVNYEQYTASNGEQTSWNYISADSNHQFYQTQYEKYWDFSAFPYRFHAVSPAPVENQRLKDDFELSATRLYIPMRYEYQTCTDGRTTQGAEPCMVAQVERRVNAQDNAHDYDLLARDDDDTYPKEINGNGGLSKTRFVALPFHHLTSKVRFGIYCPVIGEGEEHVVENVEIKVRNELFVTSATYTADLSGSNTLMSGSFTDPVQSDGALLIKVSEGANQTGNNLDHLDSEPAVVYWFECQNGLLQVPQEGVKISVSFRVKGRFLDENIEQIAKDFDGEYTIFEDVPIALKDTKQEAFDWEKNMFYTYYIILGEFTTTTPQYPIGGDKDGPIVFTCVVEPWEEVIGATDTGLED